LFIENISNIERTFDITVVVYMMIIDYILFPFYSASE